MRHLLLLISLSSSHDAFKCSNLFPGVGKTSTAECVADKTKRPLFPITCGDIGESAIEVEKNLHHNFLLAHKWGCVLLLDEADIFLAKRSKNDLRRNAVTSVFLRSLEYYAGILFLTTNRVGGIDPAFKSRIQLSLYYPRIDLDTTVKLYEVFLKRALDEQKRIGVTQFKIKKESILKFAARHYRRLQKEGYNTWNGRSVLFLIHLSCFSPSQVFVLTTRKANTQCLPDGHRACGARGRPLGRRPASTYVGKKTFRDSSRRVERIRSLPKEDSPRWRRRNCHEGPMAKRLLSGGRYQAAFVAETSAKSVFLSHCTPNGDGIREWEQR